MDLQQQVDALLKRYQEGTCTLQEEELIESVLFSSSELPEDQPLDLQYKKKLWKKLEYIVEPYQPKRLLWPYWAAAALVILTGVSAYFMVRLQPDSSKQNTVQAGILKDIAPGGNRATLTLSNGRVINLDSLKGGIEVQENGIHYSDKSSLALTKGTEIQSSEFMEVHTPKGGQYQVTLSDGTRVWLNSDSKIRYPNRFDADNRVVYLEGEAYFEVNEQPIGIKDERHLQFRKKPFIVKTLHQQARVLGTKFNINSYEPRIRTTLVSGRLEVKNDNGTTVHLVPNEQSISTTTGLHKTAVNVLQEMAWRQGKFSFDNKSFATIMNELARWYNIDVIYKNDIPKIELIGDAFRNQNISLILRLLDASNVTYKMDITKRTLLIY